MSEKDSKSWVPDVNSGMCHQRQEDGSWICCWCEPGTPCLSYKGEDPLAKNKP